MSSRGMTRAQLEARRRELERQRELARQQRVKSQVMEIIQALEKEQIKLAASGQGAWLQEEFTKIAETVKKGKETPAGPKIDSVFEELQQQHALILTLSETAEDRRDERQREKWQAEAAVVGLKLEIDARLDDLQFKQNKSEMERILRMASDLQNEVEQGNLEKLSSTIQNLREMALDVHKKDDKEAIDEELRREILKALIQSMRELGFAVGKPTVVKDTGSVALIGTLSSGRSIRFDVDISGQMEFDMNGFLERKCSDHLDEVLGLLETNFNIKSGPVQHNWKNPDKISKGSKGFPTGGNTRTMRGGQ